MEFEGKRAIVTGASRGIGLAVVEVLIEGGASVIAGARSASPRIDELVAGGALTFVAADLGTPGGPDALAAAADGQIDVLVNNVGGAPARLDGFLAITDLDWLRTIELNFLAAVRTTRAIVPRMLEHGGSIVNVVSVNAEKPDPTVLDYSAAKGALANFTKGISAEFGSRGIRANAVNPGPVATDLWLGTGGIADLVSNANGASPESVADSAVADSATRRFSTPRDVAELVAFLASDRAGNITGAGFRIDGGLISTM